jgi:hypothetical protein
MPEPYTEQFSFTPEMNNDFGYVSANQSPWVSQSSTPERRISDAFGFGSFIPSMNQYPPPAPVYSQQPRYTGTYSNPSYSNAPRRRTFDSLGHLSQVNSAKYAHFAPSTYSNTTSYANTPVRQTFDNQGMMNPGPGMYGANQTASAFSSYPNTPERRVSNFTPKLSPFKQTADAYIADALVLLPSVPEQNVTSFNSGGVYDTGAVYQPRTFLADSSNLN